MWLSHRLARTSHGPARLGLVATLVAASVGITGTSAVHAEPANGLCKMDPSRGAVPESFPVAACVDGSGIWLRNSLQVPIHLAVTGDTGKPVTIQLDQGVAAVVTRMSHPDPLLLMPGDVIRIPVGSRGASATIADTEAGAFYALAVTLARFLPRGMAVDLYEAITDFMKRIADAFGTYQDCLVGKNWIGQLGCKATLDWQVGLAFGLDATKFALARATKTARKIMSVFLDAATYAEFVRAKIPTIEKLATSARTIVQAAIKPLATTVDWRNTAYRSTCAHESKAELSVRIHNGIGRVPKPGPPAGATYDFAVEPQPAAGDLTGDGHPEVAVVLSCHQSDTSPNFILWEVQVFTDGPARLAVLVPIPDPGYRRMDFSPGELSIDSGKLVIGVGLYGPNDCNACGPSVHRAIAWRWNGRQLTRA